jgi:hypothetical protein
VIVEVVVGRPGNADGVEPGVVPEPAVLRGDEGLAHVLRDALERDDHTLFEEELTDQLAIGGVNPRRFAGRLLEGGQILGQVVRKSGVSVVRKPDSREESVDDQQSQNPEDREPLEPSPALFPGFT